MGTYLKYRFLTLVREKSFMFWALAFPLILAVLFYVSFGNPAGDGMGEKMQSVPAGVVVTEENPPFSAFLEALDGDVIEIKEYEESEKKCQNNRSCRRKRFGGGHCGRRDAHCAPFRC